MWSSAPHPDLLMLYYLSQHPKRDGWMTILGVIIHLQNEWVVWEVNRYGSRQSLRRKDMRIRLHNIGETRQMMRSPVGR